MAPYRSLRSLCRIWIVGTLAIGSCKEVAPEQGDAALAPAGGGYDDDLGEMTPEFYAADAEYLQKNAGFFYRVFNEGFSRRLDDLPQSGEVPDDKKPYTGGYYAEGSGGTDVVMVGGKSPLRKYDEAFYDGNNRSVAWEREKHTTGPSWAGHCNGYSAAAIRHPKEPERDVVRNGITFAPQDVKALLSEIYMNADYEFLGGNRCDSVGSSSNPMNRSDPTKMGECEDVNPGTLHAVIGNWIGRMRTGLVMDEFRGDEVWNYPLFKYQVLSQQTISAAQARQYVTADNSTTYIFNPSATRFVYVKTRLTYSEATKNEILGRHVYKDLDLVYVLELNSSGDIVGGEWVGQSQRDHPDFVWVPLEPMQPNGTRYMGNPHINADEVIKMWAESVGYDPNDPPRALARPTTVDDWGKWALFEVRLDGNSRGAVFAGKPVHLDITRKDILANGKIELDVLLNGTSLKKFTPSGSEPLAFSFTPGLGLNRFQFSWRKDGALVEDRYLRFYVVR